MRLEAMGLWGQLICRVVGFLQHSVSPEMGMEKATGEVDPGLGFAGKQESKEVGDTDKRDRSAHPPRGRR